MNAEIISIGYELLSGLTINTNAAYIAAALNNIGIKVAKITVVGDNDNDIWKSLTDAHKSSEIVIITGGLGPTNDDITKTVICRFFNTKLVLHQPTLENITGLLSSRNIEITQLNRNQALVPENCKVLENKLGTAPGIYIEKNNTKFIFLPGVPFEMKHIFENQVLNILSGLSAVSVIHRNILVVGLPESILAEKISAWEDSLPAFLNLAYLPSPGQIILRITGTHHSVHILNREIEEQIQNLYAIIPQYIVNTSGCSIAETIGEMLIHSGANLSLAESCTGGNIAHLITSVPGCSRFFKGSLVAYDNSIKSNILNISENELLQFGAVSKQTVEKMAISVRQLFKTDYSIAVSGIAGPDGGTADKPVGTTWIAVASNDFVLARKFVFGDNRERNITRASISALNMLRLYLTGF